MARGLSYAKAPASQAINILTQYPAPHGRYSNRIARAVSSDTGLRCRQSGCTKDRAGSGAKDRVGYRSLDGDFADCPSAWALL